MASTSQEVSRHVAAWPAGDLAALLLHWTADSTLDPVAGGVNTSALEDGAIRLQIIAGALSPEG